MQDFSLNKGKFAIIIAGLFCLYAVYGAVRDFQLPGQTDVLEPAEPIVELAPVNMQLLSGMHIFGTPPGVANTLARPVSGNNVANRDKQQQQPRPNPKPKPKPKLKPLNIKVTVTGLLASTDTQYAAAMLKVDNKPEKLYKVGEDLGKPEVILSSVESESIVIDNNGNEQTIVMKRPGLNSSQNANQQPPARGNGNNNASQIPGLPLELELPQANAAAAQGAFSPPAPEPVNLDTLPLAEDLEEELLQEQIQNELDEEIQAETTSGTASGPNFQMPVF